jgi:hypothetical protein
LKCQGHSANWLAALPTLISVDAALLLELSPIAWLGPAVSEHAGRCAALPAIPPPKTVSLIAV